MKLRYAKNYRKEKEIEKELYEINIDIENLVNYMHKIMKYIDDDFNKKIKVFEFSDNRMYSSEKL